MQGFLTVFVLIVLAFVGFVIYFIFKQIQFFIQAINLYKKMVERQDMTIKLLSDMRDKSSNPSQISSNPDILSKSSSVTTNGDISREERDKHKYTSFDSTPIDNGNDKEEYNANKSVDKTDELDNISAEKYDGSKQHIFQAIKEELTTDNERAILENLYRLDYYTLRKAGNKPDELTEEAKHVYSLLFSKIKMLV